MRKNIIKKIIALVVAITLLFLIALYRELLIDIFIDRYIKIWWIYIALSIGACIGLVVYSLFSVSGQKSYQIDTIEYARRQRDELKPNKPKPDYESEYKEMMTDGETKT
jgi:hypothetical protein